MKIIDLLNKIANGEELPTTIKYQDNYYNLIRKYNEDWEEYEFGYKNLNGGYLNIWRDNVLNDEVEIIEEVPIIVKYTNGDKQEYSLEIDGEPLKSRDYLFKEDGKWYIHKEVNFDTSKKLEKYAKPYEFKEEKKIPEKFKISYEIDEENTINLTPATMLECDLACRINEIIDYLNSKGE